MGRFFALMLMQLALLATAIGVVLWLRAHASGLLLLVIVPLALFPAGWLLVSALLPTAAKKCPKCGAEALAPAIDGTPGLQRCSACGFEERENAPSSSPGTPSKGPSNHEP
jgi:hypothetical protein